MKTKQKIVNIILAIILFVNIPTLKAAPIVFADANFKAKLISANPTNGIAFNTSGPTKIDNNNDGEIDDMTEAPLIIELHIDGDIINWGTISSLAGIGGFTNLTHLTCKYNVINQIPMNELTNLTHLVFNNNNVTSFNFTNHPNIQLIEGRQNNMTSFISNNCPFLNTIDCAHNSLTNLQFNNCPQLWQANAINNQLTNISIQNVPVLNDLFLNMNPLNSINLGPIPSLAQLSLGQTGSNLTTIDNLLPSIPNLISLYVGYSFLTSLDVSNLHSLQLLNINNNAQLASLNLKNGMNETLDFFNSPNIISICADESQVSSISNQIQGYGYSNSFVSSYCTLIPGGNVTGISGNVKYTETGNCATSSINFSSLKLSISNGSNTNLIFPNINGGYGTFVTDGNYSIIPTFYNPTYFNITPSSVTIPITYNGNNVTQDFCVNANGNFNDLEVNVIPITAARPGFNALYKIIYKNVGTSIQSGNINFEFDDTKFTLVTTTPNTTSVLPNQLNWSFSNLQLFETKEIFITFNVNNSPINNIGDLAHFSSTINTTLVDETPTNNTASLHQSIVGSFDPNDKVCIEGNQILISEVGDYVHYIIHFENTGTFPAENIIIKDIIDLSKFDINSLVPLSGSHSFTTNLKNTNQAEFIFQNINLSHVTGMNTGYVAFKIKTLPTLLIGDIFTNNAEIYFDFNSPIITNLATTIVNSSTPLAVDVINLKAQLLNSNKALLSWQAVNPVNFKEFEVQKSINGIEFESLASIENNVNNYYTFMDNNASQSCFYRLKKIDLDEKYTYSNTIKFENTSKDELITYNNPIEHSLVIHSNSFSKLKNTISIFNMQGQLVMSKELIANQNSDYVIDVSCLISGNYVIRYMNHKKIVHFKIIKK